MIRLRPEHVSQFLAIKLDAQSLPDKDALTVRAVLCNRKAVARVVADLRDQQLDGMADALQETFDSGSTRPIIAVLEKHWALVRLAVFTAFALMK